MPAISFGKGARSAMSSGMLISGVQVGASGALPRIAMPVSKYNAPARTPMKYTLSGFTLDSTGAVLANCSIEVFEAVSGITTGNEPKGRLVAMTTSDALGAYVVEVYSRAGVTFQIDAYKAGSPDVAGTTLNTLVGTQVS